MTLVPLVGYSERLWAGRILVREWLVKNKHLEREKEQILLTNHLPEILPTRNADHVIEVFT